MLNTTNVSRLYFLFFFLSLLCSLFVGSGIYPGFHLDEAWAANFSLKIFENGFLPFQAMNEYTHAWSHYLTKTGFLLFPVSIETFRMIHVLQALVGVSLISYTLFKRRGLDQASFFLALLSCSLFFISNTRFAIEITSFLVMCLGVLIYALGCSKKSFTPLLVLAILLGVSSHLIFLAPALGLLLAFHFSKSSFSIPQKRALRISSVLLFILFLKMTLTMEKPGKGFLLLALSLLGVFYSWKPAFFEKHTLQKISKTIYPILVFASGVFLCIGLFFLEGSWVLQNQSGVWAGWWSIPLFLCFLVFLYEKRTFLFSEKNKPVLLFVLFTFLITGILMIKPTPRYFHLAWVLFFAFLASSIPVSKKNLLFLVFPSLVSAAVMFKLSIYDHPLPKNEIKQRFLFFKDENRDYLNKQILFSTLQRSYCDLDSQIQTADPRLKEVFDFIKLGSKEKLKASCSKRSVWVETELSSVYPEKNQWVLISNSMGFRIYEKLE